MPKKSEGRALALISGGFDSPVAAYRMAREGWDVDYLFFYSLPFVRPRDKEMVLGCIKAVNSALGSKRKSRLFIVRNEKIHEALRSRTDALYHLIARRLMYRIAAKLAKKKGYAALVTGDNLAQVSSQTLQNLVALTPASDVPILRPLLGFDKKEIIKISEQIGTFDLSKHCKDCALGELVRPNVGVGEKEIKKVEKSLPLKTLITSALSDIEELEV
jgi:thiamine biosynthesis protein ThiI